MGAVRRLGHACLGVIFVTGGLDSLRAPGPRADKPGAAAIAARLGTDPATLVRANAAAMVAGGLALMAGRVTRLAALGLAASLVPTTVAGHAFWAETDPKQRANQRVHFLKNVSILGGCLVASSAPRDRG